MDDEEIWQTVNSVCERVPNEITEASLEELTGALHQQPRTFGAESMDHVGPGRDRLLAV